MCVASQSALCFTCITKQHLAGQQNKCRMTPALNAHLAEPRTCATDPSQVACVMGSLRGRALDWAEALRGATGSFSVSFERFMGELKKVSDRPVSSAKPSSGAAESGWDEKALRGVFLHSLCEQLRDELDALIDLAIKIDNRLRERRREKDYKSHSLLSFVPLDSAIKVCALDGKLLAQVSQQTEPLLLILSGNHRECLQFFFFIISSPQTPTLVLGHPWLKLHNPHIDWSAGKILSWSSLSLSVPAVCPSTGRGPQHSSHCFSSHANLCSFCLS